MIFVAFACLYIGLRTNRILDVDGATRCVEVYFENRIFFHGNNHLYYPVNVHFWNSLVEAFAKPADNSIAYIRRTQILNGLAMAGTLAIFFLLLCKAVKEMFFTLSGVAIVGMSNAFLLHGTNSAEPPVGLFFSTLSIWLTVAACESERKPMFFVGGMAMAYAMASYQSMVLIGPVAAVICLGYRRQNVRPAWIERIWRMGIFLGGATLSVAIAWMWSSSHKGIDGFGGAVQEFFTLHGGKSVYGELSVKKAAHIPIGFLQAVYPIMPEGASSIRTLVVHPARWTAFARIALVLLPVLVSFGVALRHRTAIWSSATPARRLAIACICAGMINCLFPLIYWSPVYDKLWLQPIMLIVLGMILLMSTLAKVSQLGLLLSRVVPYVMLVAVASNLAGTISAAWNETPCLGEARELETLIQPGDLVVLEWDPISRLYADVLQPKRNNFPVPYWAGRLGVETSAEIRKQAKETWENGGNVYFLAVLDTPPEVWNPFLGERCGTPYESFAEFRRQAKTVKSFQCVTNVIRLHILNRPEKDN